MPLFGGGTRGFGYPWAAAMLQSLPATPTMLVLNEKVETTYADTLFSRVQRNPKGVEGQKEGGGSSAQS